MLQLAAHNTPISHCSFWVLLKFSFPFH